MSITDVLEGIVYGDLLIEGLTLPTLLQYKSVACFNKFEHVTELLGITF